MPQHLPKLIFAGTATMYFAATNLAKVIPYFALGHFTTDNLVTSAVLFPLAIATNFLGIWLVRITPQEMFYKIVYVITLLDLARTDPQRRDRISSLVKRLQLKILYL